MHTCVSRPTILTLLKLVHFKLNAKTHNIIPNVELQLLKNYEITRAEKTYWNSR